MADGDPGTLKNVLVVAVVHHMASSTAWTGPSKHVGGLMGTVDVVVVVVAAILHISWSAVPAGRSKRTGRLMGLSLIHI